MDNLDKLRALSQVLDFNETYPNLNPHNDVILAIDSNGKIIIVSQAITDLFGWKQEEILGKHISTLVPEPHASKHDEYIREYIKEHNIEKTCIGRVIKGKRKDNTLIDCYLSINQAKSLRDCIIVGIIHPLE